MPYLYLALVLFLAAIILLWQAGRLQKKAGLPGGRIIYTDTRSFGSKIEEPLYDDVLGLTGKPDYIINKNGRLIPVEVKSGRAPESPYDSHIYQVTAYCILIEKALGSRPPYGIIHYEDRDFAIDYTKSLENAFLDILAEMRRDERKTDIQRSHNNARQCARCGFRNICEQKL